jgi:TIR domain
MDDENYFDVFICHNSEDKSQVRKITTQLKESGLLPWFDEWVLPPGQPWKTKLYGQIEIVRSAAVFIGNSGLGPWQEREIDAFLQEFVKRKCPVIPVILETAPEIPSLPLALTSFTYVDFRLEEPDPLQRLIWGITGKKDFLSLRDSSSANSSNVLGFAVRLKSEDLQSFLYLSKWNPEEIEQEVKSLRYAYERFSNSILKDSDILEHLKKAEVFIHKLGLANLSLRDELCARLSLVDEWFLSLIDDSENRYKLRSLRIDFIRQGRNNSGSN